MKLKRLPEDFQVEEIADFPANGGAYALYRLTKKSLGTPEALELLGRRWNVARQRISYGGLKDRHAVTRQFVTIRGGQKRNLREKLLEVAYLGQADRPFTSRDIAANRFEIVIRDLSEQAAAAAVQALEAVGRAGLPNYFDDQRFGSVGQSGEFIARAWCRGDYERALWLALADPNEDDRADERDQKRILRENWGRWKECKAALARSHRRSIVTYLADKPPENPDYRGAFARLKIDLRGLYLSAYQSHLWNQMLAATLRTRISSEHLADVSLKLGPLPFFLEPSSTELAELRTLDLPLPSARLHLDEGPLLELIREILAREGLELRELRVKYPRDSFFSKGNRAAVISVPNIAHEVSADDLYPKRRKLKLRFDLPRGSYATILVKRITEQMGTATDS